MAERSFTVDYDDPSDLKKMIFKLRRRREDVLAQKGYVGTSFNNNKHAIHQILPVIEGMLDTDITSLYDGDTNRNFYVYAHTDPTKILNIKNIKHYVLASRYGLREVPFYIGKGTGSRWLDLGRNDSHRKKRGALIKKG